MVSSPEELEKREEEARAIADQFFDAVMTPALEQAASSTTVLEAAHELVRNLPRRMRSDGLETVKGSHLPRHDDSGQDTVLTVRRTGGGQNGGQVSTPPWWFLASTTDARRSWPRSLASLSPCSALRRKRTPIFATTESSGVPDRLLPRSEAAFGRGQAAPLECEATHPVAQPDSAPSQTKRV